MKTKSKSAFKFFFHPVLPALLLTVLSPISGQAGSLWREAVTDERGMFADKRAHRLGDIVTVVISEASTSTNNAQLTSTRTGAGDANGLGTGLVNSFINAASNQQSAVSAGDRRKFPSNLLPKAAGKSPAILDTTGASTFSGGGTVTNQRTMTSNMAVQVIDVLPNGNLVIEGIRQVSFSKERQFASLRGIIRPADVSATNTVASSAVADARIDLVSEGTLSDSQKKGWLMRLDEKISPY
jgi:flagellar L-ring protein precursor FlgH